MTRRLPANITPEDEDEIVALHDEGHTILVICAKVQRGHRTVRAVLNKYGRMRKHKPGKKLELVNTSPAVDQNSTITLRGIGPDRAAWYVKQFGADRVVVLP